MNKPGRFFVEVFVSLHQVITFDFGDLGILINNNQMAALGSM